MRRSLVLVFIALSLSTAFAKVIRQPQPAADTAQAQPSEWTVDDVVMSETATGFQISPDCQWVVWVKSVLDKEKGEHISNLILSSLTEKKEIELTRGTDSSCKPQWSPDGQLIAFISTRAASKAKLPAPDEDPKPQLWLINPFGGEPWPLTDFTRGVSNYEWADPDTIFFSAQEDLTLYEHNIKENKDTSIVVEDEQHAPPIRLFQVSVKSKKVMRLTDNTDRIQSADYPETKPFALSPDGSHAVAIHDHSLRYIYDNKIKPVVFLYDLQTGSRKQIFNDSKFNILQVRWARDGKSFYAASAFTSHPQYVMATIIELYHYDLAAGTTTKVELGWENGLAAGLLEIGCFDVTSDGFIALLANGVRNKIARYIRKGNRWQREWLVGKHVQNIFDFEFGKDNKTLLYEYSTASTPSQWYCARLDGVRINSPLQLTDINRHFKDKTIAKTEVVRWKGALDEEVEGMLFYPHNYEPGKKYPLVVMIHGGPMDADLDEWWETWANPNNLMCQRDAFVLKPNYHGSSNYGLKWVESISGGKYYDLEVPDIEKGVDSLIARGLVDPDKLGAMGWSNGAILTIALTVSSTIYKVASVVAGDVEHSSDWATSEFGAAYDNYYFGKSPLEDPQLYIKKSPFYLMGSVRTPTIIFFGTEDTSVSPQQGWMHYRALQQLGNTEVRFILFPGEKHGPERLVHQRRKLEEELAWFDKYLFKSAKEENEAFKPDSPLAIALKLKAAKRDGIRYGVIVKGYLIPETVKHEGLEIGRFEVTRAQYSQFDKSYALERGKENYPANGITFEQAKAYCEWLSKLTGETYRLGNEVEMEAIYTTPGADENTLDYWAGYAVNPDDAARLQQKIKDLDGTAPLLKEVGSFKGVGTDELIFDLGGNVGEWVIAKNGSGRVLGGCADAPADSKLRTYKPAPSYIGFRIVKGTPAPAVLR